jgi:hypothetical protein
MCDLNAAAAADILKVILTDPKFDYDRLKMDIIHF